MNIRSLMAIVLTVVGAVTLVIGGFVLGDTLRDAGLGAAFALLAFSAVALVFGYVLGVEPDAS